MSRRNGPPISVKGRFRRDSRLPLHFPGCSGSVKGRFWRDNRLSLQFPGRSGSVKDRFWRDNRLSLQFLGCSGSVKGRSGVTISCQSNFWGAPYLQRAVSGVTIDCHSDFQGAPPIYNQSRAPLFLQSGGFMFPDPDLRYTTILRRRFIPLHTGALTICFPSKGTSQGSEPASRYTTNHNDNSQTEPFPVIRQPSR